MVKQCTKTTHTHDPADSNYANSVQGINAVVSAIQQARPNVYWENCENGGNMMTFNMVQNYVTSITNDASGSLPARRAVFGARFSRARMALPVCSRARNSRTWPRRTRTVMTAAAS